jgi:hypothetical protein
MIADRISALVKCTTVGVPKALSAPVCVRRCLSAIRVITTNCRPISAPPDEPTTT